MAFTSLLLLLVLSVTAYYVECATHFRIENRCNFTLWPATLSGKGADILGGGGFPLTPGLSVSVTAPPGWSGRFWARTGCKFNSAGAGKCLTGDCGGELQCRVGGSTPATLAEFTIGNSVSEKDFYDVSLVDGYNVEVGVKAVRGTGDCRYAGCVSDLNSRCPVELQVRDVNEVIVACRSACEKFNTEEYCCFGKHSTPETCGPTGYSQLFKEACPTAYSYAYDDPTSTFTCSGANYIITFCPSG